MGLKMIKEMKMDMHANFFIYILLTVHLNTFILILTNFQLPVSSFKQHSVRCRIAHDSRHSLYHAARESAVHN